MPVATIETREFAMLNYFAFNAGVTTVLEIPKVHEHPYDVDQCRDTDEISETHAINNKARAADTTCQKSYD